MILITAGTTQYKFDRLDKIALRMSKDYPKQVIIYQSNTTRMKSNKNLRVEKEINFSAFLQIMEKAKIIITHGGPATIFLCLKYGKVKPIIIPRRKKYQEHVNDHQYYFKEFFKNKLKQKRVLFLNDELDKFITSLN